MNKIYKVIWSKAKKCYVVVSEIAKHNGKCSSSLNKKIIASFLAAGLVTALPMSVDAAPFDGGTSAVYGEYNNAWGEGAFAGVETVTNITTYKAPGWSKPRDVVSWEREFRDGEFKYRMQLKHRDTGEISYLVKTYNDLVNYAEFEGTRNSIKSATAFGKNTLAGNYRATAWGNGAQALGSDSTAWGVETVARGNSGTAFGTYTISGGTLLKDGEEVTLVKTGDKWEVLDDKGRSISQYKDYVSARSTLVLAEGAKGSNTTAFGQYTLAKGDNATAFGFNTIASANNATAFGHVTAATANRATAFGIETMASGRNSTSFGYSTTASGENATAFGSGTVASGGGATSWGTDTQAKAETSTTWGNSSIVHAGRWNDSNGNLLYSDVEVLRDTSLPSGEQYYIVGIDSNEERVIIQEKIATRAIADNLIREHGRIGGYNSTAFGMGSQTYAENALASLGGTVGQDNSNAGLNSAAIGLGADVKSSNSYAMGRGATIGKNSNGSVALGGNGKLKFNDTEYSDLYVEKLSNTQYAVFGIQNDGTMTQLTSFTSREEALTEIARQNPDHTKIVGNATNAFAAVGGQVLDSATSAIAIGNGSKAQKQDSVALGSGSVADRVAATESGVSGYDASTGKSYAGDGKDDSKWKSTAAAVSVGGGTIDGKTVTRQITGVAAGYEDTDAVNVAQLKAAGFQFGANVGGTDDPSKNTRINRMGSTVNVVGEGTKNISAYSGKNVITTISQDTTGDTTITVKFDENPTFKGIQINNGPSTVTLSNSNNSLRVGDKNGAPISITNVAAGSDDTDAVNVSQLKASRTKITDGKNVTVEENFDQGKGSYSYTVNANDTKVVAGDGITVDGGELDANYVRTYTVSVNKNANSSVSPHGLISGGETNKYWDSKQTQDAVNNAYWIARAGDTEMHVSAGTLVGFKGKIGSGITVENVDGIFTFDTKPLTFAGDMGVGVGRKLGEQVNVVGGAQNLTDNNIGVVADGSNTLTVKLAKDVNLTKEGSLTIGNSVMNNEGVTATTVTAGTGTKTKVAISDKGVQVGGNTYINEAGINANNNKITNVAPGTDGTDAVNVAQLKAAGFHSGANVGGTDDPARNTRINRLGSTVNVVGEGTKNISAYSGKNVKTTISQDTTGDTTITVKFDENPTFDSVTAGTVDGTYNTIMDSKGIQINNGSSSVTLSNSNGTLRVGDKNGAPISITNVAAGSDDTDAVNVSQLKASRTKITDGKNVTVEENFDQGKGSYSYTVNANDTKVVAGDGITVDGGELDANYVRTYTVSVNRSADSQESGGVISGGETNKYWDSKQTADAINSAYWVARAGNTEMHVSAGTLVGFEGTNGITVENADGIFTFDAKPLTFVGDTGVVHRKLGEQVNVVGGAQNLTDNNIGVVADGSNTLTVKLAKDVNLTKEGSLTIGNSVMNNEGVTATTVTAGTGTKTKVAISDKGVQVGGNTYINEAGINANNNKITNVAPGTDGTDAVNLNQLNDVKWNIGTGAVNGGTNKHGGPLDLSPVGKQDGIDRSNIRFNAGAGVDISYSTILTGTSKDDKEIGYNIDISAKFQDATISFDDSGHYIQAITYEGKKYLLAGGGSGTAAPTDVISDNRAVTAELLEHYNEDIKGYEYAIEVESPFMNLNGLKDEKGKPAEIHTDDFAYAKGENAIAIGRQAEAEADNSLAVGHNADAKAENATAIGMNSHAHAENSVSIGVAASSSGNRAIVIGTTASYDSSREDPANATLPHQGSRASGQGSVVLGDHARAQSEIYTLEIAKNLDLIGTPDHLTNDAIAIGTKAEVRATNAIALGGSMSYTDENGVTKYGETNGRYVGAIVGGSAKSGIAIGGAYGEQGENGEIKQEISAAATYGLRGIAIGTGATVANKDDFTALENVLSNPEYQKAKGDFQKARAEYLNKLSTYDAIKDVPLNDPTVPSGMQITQEDKDRAKYQMNQAKAALEKATQTYSLELKKSIRLQEKDAIEESDAIAIGTKAVAQVKESIALGSNSVTTAKDRAGSRTGLSGYDPLQQDSDNDYFRGDEKYKEDDPVWRSTAGSLSVGGGTTTVKDVYGNEKEVTVTRRISNVAAGIEDSDAVNVAQLKRATSLKTDSRNTSIGLDKDGNMVVNSPYLNIQGVKTSSDYTTIINRFGTPEEYIQSLEGQKTEINSRIDSINVSREMIKGSLQKLEEDYKAQKITEAAYLAQKADYEEQWDATRRRLDDLAASLKEKDTEIANAPTHYQEAKEYYDSQANASGTDSIAVGNKSVAGGKESVSIGANNTIGTPGELNAKPDAELEKEGQKSIAIGSGNTVMGKKSMAIGTDNTVTGDRSGAIGDPNVIDASDSYSVGNDNKIAAGQNNVFALGNQVTTTTSNSVFLGSNSAYVADGKTTAGMSEYSSATINGRTYNYAGGKPAGVVSVGDEGKERRIQNVAAGKVSADSTDAINGSQLYSALDNVNNSFTNLGDQISNVDNRTRKGIAGAAALAALHPMEFDPDDKLTFAAGMGHYRGESAAALGMFYRPDEKVMFSVGGTLGNGENMINAGVSFSLDRTPRVTGSRTAMAKEIVQLREQVAQLTALVNQIAANQGMTMPVAPTIFPDTPENHYAYVCIDQLQKQGYITGYAGRTLTREEFAAAFDRAMAGGATLDKRIVKEFEPELSHVRVAHVEGNGNEEGKWYERPRASYDKVEKHKIPMKHFRVQKNNNNK